MYLHIISDTMTLNDVSFYSSSRAFRACSTCDRNLCSKNFDLALIAVNPRSVNLSRLCAFVKNVHSTRFLSITEKHVHFVLLLGCGFLYKNIENTQSIVLVRIIISESDKSLFKFLYLFIRIRDIITDGMILVFNTFKIQFRIKVGGFYI